MNKRKDIALVAIGFLIAAFIFSVPGKANAEPTEKQITASYNGIKVVINGEVLQPKDASGQAVLPFVSDGTTYLPLRAVAEAVGYDVTYNSGTVTALLTKKADTVTPTPTPTPTPKQLNTTLQSNLVSRLDQCINSAGYQKTAAQNAYKDALSRGLARSSYSQAYIDKANAISADIDAMKSLQTSIRTATSTDELYEYQEKVAAYEAAY